MAAGGRRWRCSGHSLGGDCTGSSAMRRHTACFCGCWFSVTLVWAAQLLREAGHLVEPPEAGEPEPVDVRSVGGGGLLDTVAKGTPNETELVELDQAAAAP